ncbi:carboxypeptidase-like regulatory domain-containing protein [Mucilaginibacter sp.]|uniref:carboxypeptidase-like regulatory domain-containing protein n=1 Tax=Mucilaginibacter sp. TaxID=1882438 RepID=UPI0025FBC405|nr:carboxypeptidase-like regulatory domain-containing protein [Mucilaginibacter sp.]
MRKIFFTIALFVSIQTIAFCQGSSPVLENAVSKIKTTITDRIIEKAYLHFDRPYPYYVAGDVMYFKAYVTMGELHQLSTISGILHVDLIGNNNVLLQTKSILLSSGLGWGDFTLPDTLQKGTYRIRAYTNYMRNGEHAYFFNKNISVSSINNVDRVAAVNKKAGQPSLQFFPEGGNMVTDVHTKVAFKAVGADGLGIEVKGAILDDANTEVTKMPSSHFGMGTFEFIPEDGKKYKAKVTYSNGAQATVNLPDAAAKGIALAVNTNDPSKISIEIRANRAYYKENLNKEVNLLIYWSGSVKKVNTKLDNEVLGLDLPTAGIRTGIMQVTLFSDKGEPLSERLAFIQNPDLLNLAVTSNKPSFAKRENVVLNFNAKSTQGPAKGSFSVSVIDESKILVDENAESTILTNILLTSDLKGYVEKPNYYFANVNNETRGNLDALMLTQGYRRFVWKQLLADNSTTTAAVYKPEQAINLTGKVKTRAGVPLPNLQVNLVPNGVGALKTATTDAQGSFQFNDMVFETGKSFLLKTDSKSGKNAAVITLDIPDAGAAIDPANEMDASYNSSADILASLQNGQKAGEMTASNDSRVYLKDDRVVGPKKTATYRSSNLGGAGHADQVINGDNFANAPSLVTALNGVARDVDFVNGVPFLKTGQVVQKNSASSNPMLIVVDGIVGGKTIEDIPPRIVETVEILKENNSSIYGVAGGGGVIVITTRQNLSGGATISKEMAPGVYSFTPAGFYKAKEFYSPQYNVADASKGPDNRTTIYWNPNVVTDSGGNGAISFFNADGTGTYRVVIEGIDLNGNLGRQVFKYKVN